MLLSAETVLPNIKVATPKTEIEFVLKNLYNIFKKYSWFEGLFLNTSTKADSYFVIKTKQAIDTSKYPDFYDGYVIKYFWDGREKLSIDDAVRKITKKFKNEIWFIEARVINKNQIGIKTKYKLNTYLKYFEDYPVRYELV